jgi:hypothetical protein
MKIGNKVKKADGFKCKSQADLAPNGDLNLLLSNESSVYYSNSI